MPRPTRTATPDATRPGTGGRSAGTTGRGRRSIRRPAPWRLGAVALAVMALAGVSPAAAAPVIGAAPDEPAPTTTVADPTADETVDPDPDAEPVDDPHAEPVDDPDAEPVDDPDAEPVEEPVDEPVTEGDVVFPPGPPPGFSEQQYRSFIDHVQTCGFDAGRVCEQVYSWTGSAALAEAAQWVYDIPVRIALIAAVAFAVNLLVRRSIDRYARRIRRRSADDVAADPTAIRRDALRVTTASATIARAATVVIFVIAALITLGELGVTLGPLLAGAGIAGIALGFGAQNMVRDVLAGFFVVFEDQYGVGDIIDAGRATGTVEEVTLRITKVRDVHGTLWFVPNGTIEEVGNKTQLWARAIIDFDIDYRADHETAGRIIKETADRLWRERRPGLHILEEPELWGVESLADSAVVVRLAVKCAPAEQWALARTLRGEVKKALDDAGIEIPFPQHTIWVHADPDVTMASPDR